MKKRSATFALLCALASFMLLTLLAGCAGGTRGTGSIGSRVYEGVLLDNNGAPLPDVTVSLDAAPSAGSAAARAASFSVTDSLGHYSIAREGLEGNVTYTFHGNNIDASFELEGLAPDIEDVTVDFRAAADGKSVTPTKVDVSEGAGSAPGTSPTPRPTPGGGSRPPPTPTHGADDSHKFVTICHHPAGNGKPQTISVSQSALASHLAHGDTIGACPAGTGNKPGKPKPAKQ